MDKVAAKPPTCGGDIRTFRINRGRSVVDMAEEMKISRQTLIKAEQDRDLWLKSRKAIADYFDRLPEFEGTEITVISIWPHLLEENRGEAEG